MRIWIGSAISQERSLWILDPPLLQPEIIGHPESPTGFRGRTAIYRRFFQHEDLRAVLGSRKCGNRGGRAAADNDYIRDLGPLPAHRGNKIGSASGRERRGTAG